MIKSCRPVGSRLTSSSVDSGRSVVTAMEYSLVTSSARQVAATKTTRIRIARNSARTVITTKPPDACFHDRFTDIRRSFPVSRVWKDKKKPSL